MIWGGLENRPGAPGELRATATGALLDPVTGDWTTLRQGPLSNRYSANIEPVGNEVLVWGGFGSQALVDGAMLEADQTWRSISSAPLEVAGAELVWGRGAGLAITTSPALAGALYEVNLDSWTLIAMPDLAADTVVSSVWIGDSFVISASGGGAGLVLARLDLDTLQWTMLAPPPVGVRSGSQLVWTGDEVVIAASDSDEPIAAYAPASSRWRLMPAAQPCTTTNAFWTGSRILSIHGSLDPETGACTEPRSGAPDLDSDLLGREYAASAWGSSNMISWGGSTTSGQGLRDDGVLIGY